MKSTLLKKRILIPILVPSVLLGALVFTIFIKLHYEKNAFHFYCKEYVVTLLQGNTLDLHYTLADPSAFQLEKLPPSLPVYHAGDALTEDEKTSNWLERLHEIKFSTLSENEQQTYQILDTYLTELLALEQYDYMREPLSPSSGIHTTFPVLLAEYTFRSKEDVEDYLTLLSQSGDYILGILQYEQEKSAAGLFTNPHAAKTVVDACYDIMELSLLEEGKHFLLTSFSERLEPLISSGQISTSEALSYEEKNNRLITTVLAPAYITLADGILLLENSGSAAGGLCTYDDGKAYYQSLVRRNTGSDKTVSQLKKLLLSRFQDSYNSLIALLISNDSLMEQTTYSNIDAQFPLKEPLQMLEYLKKKMKDSFPVCTNTSVTVKQISQNTAEYFSPAFYLTPPLDDFSENVIYINPQNALSGIGLFTTLAHEGYPGHLYQSVYYQNHVANHMVGKKQPAHDTIVRNMVYHGGYTEGWAMYVETLSYEYAKELIENDSICDALRLESEMQLSLYCLLDIAIHYDGASFKQVEAILKSFGITDKNSAKHLYHKKEEYSRFHLVPTIFLLGVSRLIFHPLLPSLSPDNLCPKAKFSVFLQFLRLPL